MVRLVPTLPWKNFEAAPNMKLYTWAMNSALFNTLEKERFQGINMNTIWERLPETKNIIFVRHLESMYNEYKEEIRKDPRYQEFNTTNDAERKFQLALQLLEDFRRAVWLDYSTWVSKKWHEQGELYGKLYADLIKANPDIFPTLIVVSPYLRTRITAHYFLKYIDGLDLDINRLIDPKNSRDLILGQFQWKPVAIKIMERIRERDHGSDIAPSFLRDFIASHSPFSPQPWLLSEDADDLSYYYGAPLWGESQVQVTERVRSALASLMSEPNMNILAISHHIAILAVMNILFGWSHNTYYMLDKNWRPKNWGLTIVSQIPTTQSGQSDKLRVAWYNLQLAA